MINDQHHMVKIEFTEEHEQAMRFTNPVAIVSTTEGTEVLTCLQEIENWTTNGYYAAGYITYEAGAYLSKELPINDFVRDESDPLIWFGIYDEPKSSSQAETTNEPYHVTGWEQENSREAYTQAIAKVKDHIALGDTYQVNYTMRLRSRFLGSAYSYYEVLKTKQRAPYSAYVHDGKRQILSLSPELFFKKRGHKTND
ncbi:chorismate-binding protein [Geomicrobium sp. JCM 19055]|uniref:chorismate-binding protein n=1 Tax=Geomicrobium sp. JCM 19055 TaxID=1460649 RepID=UPI00045ED2C3|nr:chorismate-binding protein [Geomicrobium sp. JCM 19055]GAJ99932.1 para-aminobenzoate synthase, aminase component [Geomicrobium sp. JCM 19055]